MVEPITKKCSCGSLMMLLQPNSVNTEQCTKCGDVVGLDDDDFIEMIGC